MPAWERPDLRPVSEPVLAGALFVVYVAVPSGLSVVALDPGSGRTQWQMEVSRALTHPGLWPTVGVVGGNVVLFRAKDGLHELVAVDAGTGVERWASPPATFTTWPQACDDDRSIVCAFGRTGTAPGPERPLRFAGDSGAPQPSPLIWETTYVTGRELAPGLFETGTRSPETLVATKGAVKLWSRPLSEVFPGGGVSSEHGSDIDRMPGLGLFVGSISGAPLEHNVTETKIDLASSMTVGFGIEDGRPVWSEPGTRYRCGRLSCPHSHVPGTNSPAEVTQGVRIRARGSAFFPASGEPRLEPGASVTLEGFDLATGKTIWSFDAGPSVRLVSKPAPPMVSEDALVLVEPAGRPIELNLVTGARRDLPADVTAWCRPTATTYEPPPGHSPYPTPSFATLLSSTACDATGTPVPLPAQVPSWMGDVSGSIIAMSAFDRVRGMRATS